LHLLHGNLLMKTNPPLPSAKSNKTGQVPVYREKVPKEAENNQHKLVNPEPTLPPPNLEEDLMSPFQSGMHDDVTEPDEVEEAPKLPENYAPPAADAREWYDDMFPTEVWTKDEQERKRGKSEQGRTEKSKRRKKAPRKRKRDDEIPASQCQV
jgi:hypothetical protein